MLTLMDYALAPFYLLVVFIIAYWIRARHRDNPIYKYFIPGLFVKIFGGIAFGMVYAYYYGFGDTFNYFAGANALYDMLTTNAFEFSEAFFSSSSELLSSRSGVLNSIQYANSEEEFFTVKCFFWFNLFSFKKYLLIAIILNTVCFISQWYLFRVLSKAYESSITLLAISILFIPTVIFWGSGLMKDTIVMACLLGILAILIDLFRFKGFSIWRILLAIVLFYIGFRVKSYVVLSLVPALLLGGYLFIRKHYLGRLQRLILGPVLILGFLVVGYFSAIQLSEQSSKYQLDRLQGITQGFQSWHSSLGGSSYSLGEIDFSPVGLVSKIPAALNVTFFRPYVWEVSNPLMVLTAIESLLVFFISIFLIFKLRLALLSLLLKDELAGLLFCYSVFLGFAVGFTSYNFGALARYKIPCLTTYLLFLVIAYAKLKKETVSEDQLINDTEI